MMDDQVPQSLFSTRRQPDEDVPAIWLGSDALYQAALLESVHQIDGAVMAHVQPVRVRDKATTCAAAARRGKVERARVASLASPRPARKAAAARADGYTYGSLSMAAYTLDLDWKQSGQAGGGRKLRRGVPGDETNL
jgi:hypothetical protein